MRLAHLCETPFYEPSSAQDKKALAPKFEGFKSYEDMKAILKQWKVRSPREYDERRQVNANFMPEHPAYQYSLSDEWRGWDDFLGQPSDIRRTFAAMWDSWDGWQSVNPRRWFYAGKAAAIAHYLSLREEIMNSLNLHSEEAAICAYLQIMLMGTKYAPRNPAQGTTEYWVARNSKLMSFHWRSLRTKILNTIFKLPFDDRTRLASAFYAWFGDDVEHKDNEPQYTDDEAHQADTDEWRYAHAEEKIKARTIVMDFISGTTVKKPVYLILANRQWNDAALLKARRPDALIQACERGSKTDVSLLHDFRRNAPRDGVLIHNMDITQFLENSIEDGNKIDGGFLDYMGNSNSASNDLYRLPSVCRPNSRSYFGITVNRARENPGDQRDMRLIGGGAITKWETSTDADNDINQWKSAKKGNKYTDNDEMRINLMMNALAVGGGKDIEIARIYPYTQMTPEGGRGATMLTICFSFVPKKRI